MAMRYYSARTLWKLAWFLRDFLYDPDLFSQDEVDEKALSGLYGGSRSVRSRYTALSCSTATDLPRPASLTSLISRDPPMPPRLNPKRARFVLSKIDEIVAWEQRNETERDTRANWAGICRCGRASTGRWRT
jgi:hypothetical protein